MSIRNSFSTHQSSALEQVISTSRFGTYLSQANADKDHALRLYAWNMAISAAFLTPLNMLEITTRNAIAQGIEAVHGPQWPWAPSFRNTLQNPSRRFNPRRELTNCASQHSNTGKVITELKFVFWERLLIQAQQPLLWNAQFNFCFPSSPRTIAVSDRRDQLRNDLEKLRRLRNRIAHHEPIFTRDLRQDLHLILKAIEWRDPIAATWVQSIQTVDHLLYQRP